jgi:2',3'-cyclic-nucleotide 2'-phosphodiesterase (5'-nucleotidase family)
MGNIVTDAMRDYTQADIAFTNAGGLREDILCPSC